MSCTAAYCVEDRPFFYAGDREEPPHIHIERGVSIESLLVGRASGESQRSLKRLLSQRASSLSG